MASRRRPVNKRKSVRKFRNERKRTQVRNIAKPGRGGFRL